MKYKLIIFCLVIIGVTTSCNDWVTGVDPIINNVEDDILDNPELMDFLILGIKGHLSEAADIQTVEADLLSDQLEFNRVVGGTFTSFIDIDDGIPPSDRTGAFNEIHNLRFFAEDLIRRAEKVGVERKDVKFTGLFYSAIAYQMLASYWALTPNQPGSPINGGPLVPQDELYTKAIDNFTQSLEFAPDDLTKRQINTFIAECYLYQNKFSEAKSAALKGLVQGDSPFEVLYSDDSNSNYFYSSFGPGRYQGIPDPRFINYINEDPNEVNRIKLIEVNGYMVQDKYNRENSPITLVSWQENELILAEISIRENNLSDALQRINLVRSSHSLAPLNSVDMDVLIAERDKELFLTGKRLIDERRFNIWHLGNDTWQYFPIPDDEKNANPNLN